MSSTSKGSLSLLLALRSQGRPLVHQLLALLGLCRSHCPLEDGVLRFNGPRRETQFLAWASSMALVFRSFSMHQRRSTR